MALPFFYFLDSTLLPIIVNLYLSLRRNICRCYEQCTKISQYKHLTKDCAPPEFWDRQNFAIEMNSCKLKTGGRCYISAGAYCDSDKNTSGETILSLFNPEGFSFLGGISRRSLGDVHKGRYQFKQHFMDTIVLILLPESNYPFQRGSMKHTRPVESRQEPSPIHIRVCQDISSRCPEGV
jgi:hypothetical protein